MLPNTTTFKLTPKYPNDTSANKAGIVLLCFVDMSIVCLKFCLKSFFLYDPHLGLNDKAKNMLGKLD